MQDVKISKLDVLEIENATSSQNIKHDNMFLIIPDDASKTMIIAPSIQGATLKPGIKEAEALLKIIEHQIRLWR